MNIVLWRNLGASWHLLERKKKRTHTTLYKSWLSPSRGDSMSPFFRHPLPSPQKKQTRVKIFDSAIQSPAPQRDEEKKGDDAEGVEPPHLRPAAPPPPPPATAPLSNSRLSRAAPRRHHSGPWFLWFRWYWNRETHRNQFIWHTVRDSDWQRARWNEKLVRTKTQTVDVFPTFIIRSHCKNLSGSDSGGDSPIGLCAIIWGGIMLSLPLRGWDKIIAPNRIRERLMRGREPLENAGEVQ